MISVALEQAIISFLTDQGNAVSLANLSMIVVVLVELNRHVSRLERKIDKLENEVNRLREKVAMMEGEIERCRSTHRS